MANIALENKEVASFKMQKFFNYITENIPTYTYEDIKGLRIEARQKLDAIRPVSLGQASRITGVSPADIAVLVIYLEQNSRNNGAEND